MDGMEAVFEAPEAIETETQEVDTDLEQGSQADAQPDGGDPDQGADDPYSPKASKAYSDYLKALRADATNPDNAKYARLAKDNHSRLYQLHQLEPKGIDGVREKYALFDALSHGELKGADAIGAMQDELRSIQEVDELLAAGDPRALDELGDDFNEGLAKLTPAILDRIREINPEAYSAAVMPHFTAALRQSALVGDFGGLVEILNEQPPNWLTADQKSAWANDKMGRLVGAANKMVDWFNAQFNNAGKQGDQQQPKPQGAGRGKPADNLSDREQAFHKEQQDHHWKTQINPGLDKHAESRFRDLSRPYAPSLQADPEAAKAANAEFIRRIVAAANGNKTYTDQIARYRGQKNPDPKTVLNFAKVEFDKHAKNVMADLVKDPVYKHLFKRGAAPQAGRQNAQSNGQQRPRGPVAPGVKIVAVKPPMSDIDHRGTPLSWLHEKKYRLNNGDVVQVRQ